MTSSGALQSAELLLAKDTILSALPPEWWGGCGSTGGGIQGVPVLGFDMGGTSTDVFCVASADDAFCRSCRARPRSPD